MRNILSTNIQFGCRHRDFRPPNQAKPIADEHSIRRSSSRFATAEPYKTYYRRTVNAAVVTDEHSIRQSSSRWSTAESSETYDRRTFNSAVVVAISDRQIKRNLLNIRFGGRDRDFWNAKSNETYFRRAFNSAVVVAIFARRIKRNVCSTKIQLGGRHRDGRPPNQAKPIIAEHSIRRSSSRFSTAASNETLYRGTFNSAVVIAIFDRRIK
jgi:hypothetical protein